MFKNPFSFNGRIRRKEYGISFLLYFSFITTMNLTLSEESTIEAIIFLILTIPSVWFLWAQGAKRCHDLGHKGYFQFIPFYFIWLIFGEGDRRRNKYGENPKFSDIPDWDWQDEPIYETPGTESIDNVDGDGLIINAKK